MHSPDTSSNLDRFDMDRRPFNSCHLQTKVQEKLRRLSSNNQRREGEHWRSRDEMSRGDFLDGDLGLVDEDFAASKGGALTLPENGNHSTSSSPPLDLNETDHDDVLPSLIEPEEDDLDNIESKRTEANQGDPATVASDQTETSDDDLHRTSSKRNERLKDDQQDLISSELNQYNSRPAAWSKMTSWLKQSNSEDNEAKILKISVPVCSSSQEEDQSGFFSKEFSGFKNDFKASQVAIKEVEELRADVRRKRDIYGVPGFRHLPISNSSDSGAGSLLTDEEKVMIAKRSSSLMSPGAFRSDIGELTEPSTSALVSRMSSTLTGVRSKRSVRIVIPDVESRSSPAEEEAIENLQTSMNALREDVDTVESFLKDQITFRLTCPKFRKFWIYVGCFIAMMAIITTVIIIIRTTPDSSYDETELFLPPCYTRSSNHTERYSFFRSNIVSQFPEMTGPIDSNLSAARKALCWLADSDALGGLLEVQAAEDGGHALIQRFALTTIHFQFGGKEDFYPIATNWLSKTDVCEWSNITCDESRITKLSFSNSNEELEGSIPTEIAMLSDLEELSFDQPWLTGKLPEELWTLTHLETLRLLNTQLIGTISSDITNLRELNHLEIQSSILAGQFPDISELKKLTLLSLQQNYLLEGSISIIAELTNLEEVVLTEVSWTGTLPASIGNFTNLTKLVFEGFWLYGSIPNEIGNLSNLDTLSITFMRNLESSIPSDIGRLTNLEVLNLANNCNLSGSVPQEICDLLMSGSLLDFNVCGVSCRDCNVLDCSNTQNNNTLI